MESNKQIPDWEQLKAYLLYERKMSRKEEAVYALKSRHTTLSKFFKDKEFNRANFNLFLAYADTQGWSDAYKNKFIAMACHIAKYLGILDFKEDFTYFRENKKWQGDTLTPDEITAIVNLEVDYRKFREFLNKRNRLIGHIVAYTGCRIGEVINLKQADIHAEPPHVIFRDTKTDVDRAVPIPLKLYEELKALPPGEYAFVSARGNKKLRSGELCNDWKRRAKLLGIRKNVTSHLFRHSFITRLHVAGCDLESIGTLVGHSDPKTTKRYIHSSLNHLADIALSDPMRKGELTYERSSEKAKEFIKNNVNDKVVPVIREDEKGVTIFLPRY